jgi:curved DNA-binding protein CbpA
MNKRDPQFDAYVLKIHEVLDRLDYYRLLGVDPKARHADVRKAFYAIAAKFHPDRNRNADPRVQRALYDIFKRLNESYRVLGDPQKRATYDEGLRSGEVRFVQDMRRNKGPRNPEDSIQSPQARQFYRQAADELEAGNLMNADLHLKVAASREPGSQAIVDLAEKLKAAKQEAKNKKR